MSDRFWAACTEALLACRRNDAAVAARMLQAAEVALDQGASEHPFRAKRRDYIDRFKAHLEGMNRGPGTAAGAQSAALVDERLFYPRPPNVALRNRLRIPHDHLVLVAVQNGLRIRERGAGVLLEAVASLNRQGLPVTLVRVGTEPGRQDTAPSPQVRDMGSVPRRDLPEIMAAGDVLICAVEPGSASLADKMSRILECFAMGRPVILPRDVHGLDVVDKRDACVLKSFDVAGVVNVIKQIKADQSLADTLAKCAVDFYLTVAAEYYRKPAEREDGRAGAQLKPHTAPTPPGQAADSIIVKPVAEGSRAIVVSESGEIQRLQARIRRLEQEKHELSVRLRSMPSIDPLCLSEPTSTRPVQKREDFGIIVFGHTRLDALGAVLESLKRQDALKYTEVWLDGHQGNENLKRKIEKTAEVVKKYSVKHLHRQSGNFGFRKMLILGLVEMSKKYRDILVLEDDCFPTRDAVAEFCKGLDLIRDDDRVFSVYGHHFLTASEKETCSRFQGWGWATTAAKLMPVLRQLIDCYSMTEERYLEFVRRTLTSEIRARIDVTPPRQPSYVLENFFGLF